MAKIGIFWVYKNQVIGKARDLGEGQETVPGIIDSPDSHIDLWEFDASFVVPFPELKGSEYQDIPRGRVLYATKASKAIVYMDKVLHTQATRNLVADFFQLKNGEIIWKIDDHYTTQSSELDGFFD